VTHPVFIDQVLLLTPFSPPRFPLFLVSVPGFLDILSSSPLPLSPDPLPLLGLPPSSPRGLPPLLSSAHSSSPHHPPFFPLIYFFSFPLTRSVSLPHLPLPSFTFILCFYAPLSCPLHPTPAFMLSMLRFSPTVIILLAYSFFYPLHPALSFHPYRLSGPPILVVCPPPFLTNYFFSLWPSVP